MSNHEPIQAAAADETGLSRPATLLFVDDEENILNALKRLFRPLGYRILTAASGAQGLALFEQEEIDLVVSDMRMPEMNGAKFLEQVRQRWPETVRILLTGYAEIGATIDAINKGQIYRYISKPWEDNDIVLVVRHALERRQLEQEKRRLEELTRKQNEELKDLNANLEKKVRERTEEVRQTMGFLEIANEKLKQSFLTSIKIFSGLIELREGAMAGHSRRVADLARSLAKRLKLSDTDTQDVLVAALLHDIGKIGLPDKLLAKPFVTLAGEERAEVIRHPATGQAALMGLEQLRGAAGLIRSHHERFDGMGFPDGLSGMNIPLGARILAVANDYDALQIGTLLSRRLTPDEALAFIVEGRGKRYDPQVADSFVEMVGGAGKANPARDEIALHSPQLRPGMSLSRDLVGEEGILLLSRDHVLDEAIIEQIRSFEKSVEKILTIHVWANNRG